MLISTRSLGEQASYPLAKLSTILDGMIWNVSLLMPPNKCTIDPTNKETIAEDCEKLQLHFMLGDLTGYLQLNHFVNCPLQAFQTHS